MTAQDAPLSDAVLLAGPSERHLDGRPASLVLLDDGRIGYAAGDSFLPVGEDPDLQRITVNPGDERGTSVISLEFAAGEVRETVRESATAVGKRLRAEGYAVSVQRLAEPAAPPVELPVERLDGTDVAGGAATEVAAVRARPTPGPGHDADADAGTPDPTAIAAMPARREAAPVAPAAEQTVPVESAAESREEPAKRRRPSPAVLVRAGGLLGRGTLSLLRLAVLIVGGVVVGILVIYVLMVLTKANPANGLVKFFKDASKPLAWQFKDLFTPRTRRANVVENYGLAAVVYLVVTVAIARVLASIGKKMQR